MSLQISRHTPAFFQWFNAKPMRLGLDKGGVNLTMRVALDHDASAAVDIARSKITALFNDDLATRIVTPLNLFLTQISQFISTVMVPNRTLTKAVSLIHSNDVFEPYL